MIDIIGAIALAALSVGITGTLVLGSPLDPRRATRVLVVAAAWFTVVTVLAGAGVFARFGPAAIGLAVLTPVVVALLGAGSGSTVRTLALGVPVARLATDRSPSHSHLPADVSRH